MLIVIDIPIRVLMTPSKTFLGWVTLSNIWDRETVNCKKNSSDGFRTSKTIKCEELERFFPENVITKFHCDNPEIYV